MVSKDYEQFRLTEKSYKIIEYLAKVWTHPNHPDNNRIIEKIAEELFYTNVVRHTRVCNYFLSRETIYECLWLDACHVVNAFVNHEFHKDDTEYLDNECLDHIDSFKHMLEKYFDYLADGLSNYGVVDPDDLIVQLKFLLKHY